MDVEGQGVIAESPAAPETPTEPTAQAPSQPVNNGQGQSVPYERFAQVNGRMRQYEQQNAALNERIKQLEQSRAPQQQQMSDEERALREAREALHRVDPNLPKYDERLQTVEGALRQFVAQQNQAQLQRAVSHISALAKAENLPGTKEYMQRLVKLVAAEAQMIENGDDRYKAGDFSVLDEAFANVKAQFLSHHQRQGAAALGQTKLNTTQLPKPGASTMPGEPAPKPLEAGKEREYRRDMHSDARRMLRELTSQG